MPLKRTQPPNFEASANGPIENANLSYNHTVLRLDGSKALPSGWAACFSCSIYKLPDHAFKAERYSTGHDVPRLGDVLV